MEEKASNLDLPIVHRGWVYWTIILDQNIRLYRRPYVGCNGTSPWIRKGDIDIISTPQVGFVKRQGWKWSSSGVESFVWSLYSWINIEIDNYPLLYRIVYIWKTFRWLNCENTLCTFNYVGKVTRKLYFSTGCWDHGGNINQERNINKKINKTRFVTVGRNITRKSQSLEREICMFSK